MNKFNNEQKEHVTTYFYKNYKKFMIKNFTSTKNKSKIRDPRVRKGSKNKSTNRDLGGPKTNLKSSRFFSFLINLNSQSFEVLQNFEDF